MRNLEVVGGEAWSPQAGLTDHYIPGWGGTPHVFCHHQAAEARTHELWDGTKRPEPKSHDIHGGSVIQPAPNWGVPAHAGSSPPPLIHQGCISQTPGSTSEKGRTKREARMRICSLSLSLSWHLQA